MSDYDDWKARAAERKKIRDAERKASADLGKQGKNVNKDSDYMRKYRQKQKDDGIMGTFREKGSGRLLNSRPKKNLTPEEIKKMKKAGLL